MRHFLIIFFVTLLIFSCKKEEPVDLPDIPIGADPYTESDIQFVPYTEDDEKYELMPSLSEELTLNFKERVRSEDYWAWDQTRFTFSTDPELEVEFRLRYLQSDASQKTLAIYLPYRDPFDSLQTTLFEMPINAPDSIETGFFQNLIDFHDTLVINSIEWYDVYEVKPLTSTDPDEDDPQNFEKIFYNKIYGLIEMDQKNGKKWILEQ